MAAKYYDNSRISDYKACPRKFYFKHIRGFQRQGREATPLSFGSSWHAAMDIVWALTGRKSDEHVHKLACEIFLATWEEKGQIPPELMSPEDEDYYSPRLPAFGFEMLWNYIKIRKEFLSNVSVIAIEPPFAVPIDPSDDSLFYIGRLDKVFESKGRIKVGEHKTTAMYQGRAPNHIFKYNYVDGWSLNSQVDGYLHAAHMIWGDKVKSVMVDVALVHKKNHELFKFIPVERALTQLDAFIFDVNDWVKKIEADKDALATYRTDTSVDVVSNIIATDRTDGDTLPAFSKNCNSCFDYNSKCQFFDLCRFWGNPENHSVPDGYKVEFWSPYETNEIHKLPGHEDKPEGE